MLLVSGEVPDAAVVRVAQPQFPDRRRRQAVLAQPASQRGRQLRVHEEPHGSGRGQDGVVNVARRVGDAGADVLGFQVGEAGTEFRP